MSSYNERRELYRQISEIRNRPLLTYVTSSRPGAGAQIGGDAVSEFARNLDALPEGTTAVDILVVSNGGDPTVSWRIVRMLRDRFENLGVLLPYTAYSAATLIALGADEIVMHPFSNLGPVDPQLQARRAVPGSPGQQQDVYFGSEDLDNYLQFARQDVGITDQDQLQLVFGRLVDDIGAVPIGVAKRSAQLASSLGEKLLALHMGDNDSGARVIADALHRSFYHHGYPVDRTEAKGIGLPVIFPETPLEKLMWQVWLSFETEMQCNVPFNPIAELYSDASVRSALFGPSTQYTIPAGLTPQVAQQAHNQVLQNIPAVSVPPVKAEQFGASIESEYARSEFRTEQLIYAQRWPDLTIQSNVVQVANGWRYEPAV